MSIIIFFVPPIEGGYRDGAQWDSGKDRDTLGRVRRSREAGWDAGNVQGDNQERWSPRQEQVHGGSGGNPGKSKCTEGAGGSR